MPIVFETEQGDELLSDENRKDILSVKEPTKKQIFRAAFEQENSLVSAIVHADKEQYEYDPDYNPFSTNKDDLIGYEEYADSFIDSYSAKQTESIKTMIDKEKENREMLNSSGLTGFSAQMAAGLTDPITLALMFTGIGPSMKGTSAAKTALKFATVGAASETVTDAALRATQETRSIEESLLNIGGSTIFSGVLGGTAKGLQLREFEKISKVFEENLDSPNPKIVTNGTYEEIEFFEKLYPMKKSEIEEIVPSFMEDIEFEEAMAGEFAQKIKEPIEDIEFEEVVLPKEEIRPTFEPKVTGEDIEMVSAAKLEKLPVSPALRLSTSPLDETRQVASAMLELPFVQKGNIKGVTSTPTGGTVETRIKLWDVGIYETISNMKAAYKKYRGGKGIIGRTIDDIALKGKSKQLSYSEFSEEVGRAMMRGDVSDIPEVEQAAKFFRKKVFDPLKDEAIALGKLPEDVTPQTAASYLSRVYKTKKIIDERPEWDRIVRTWLEGKKNDALLIEPNSRTPEQIKDALLTPEKIEESIRTITNNILGSPIGRNPHIRGTTPSPLKGRVFLIPDEMIEEFLETDIDTIARQYTRTMAPEIELSKMFGDSGLEKYLKNIEKSWDAKIKDAKTKGERRSLTRRKLVDLRDIQAVRDKLTGVYKVPEDPNAYHIRVGRFVRDFNYVRMLGMMTVSALPDLARPVAVNGLKPVAKGLLTLATSPKTFKIARKQAIKFAAGLDMELNGRAFTMAEIGDVYARGNVLERGMRVTSDKFSKLTGISQWNAAIKQFTGVVTADRLIEESLNWAAGTIKKNAMKRVAQAGIDEDMAKRIANQFNKYGDDGLLKLSNGHLWDDQEALESFSAAVLRDVDRTIVTPGVGEAPLLTSGEMGKIIFQFKSFAASAHQKVLIADLQHRDKAALEGFLLSVGLGTLSYGLKNYIRGREISDDPATVIKESLDNSGVMGYFWDVNNIIEKSTDGKIGVSALMGEKPMSRYVSRNIIGALFGPSIGTVEDLRSMTAAAASGEFTKKDLRKLRMLLPAQNLFYMRQLLNKLEEKVGEELPE